jgi:hypothetical protein
MTKRMAIAVSLLAAACASGGGGSEGIVDFDARLSPTTGNQVTGDARAVAAVGSTAVTVDISNAAAGASHPWHVHQGECGTNGPVVGAGTDYPPLVVGTDGRARAVATIGVQLSDQVPYFVNVHLSRQAMGTIVSCGRLVD